MGIELGSFFYQVFAELIDRKIKDVKSVGRHGDAAVCCLELHDFVVQVWVEGAMLLTMKVPSINFEGLCYRRLIAMFSALLGTTVVGLSRQASRVENEVVGITVTTRIHY